jgi:hypothetical protein
MNIVFLAFAAAGLLVAQEPITTNRYDRFGSGANTHETILDNGNVNGERFGKLYSYPVDGSVYAQPLYMCRRSASTTARRETCFTLRR